MPSFEIVPGLTFVTRDAWGARTDIPRLGAMVARSVRTHAIIHHTVMVDGDATPNLWETDTKIFEMMRRLQTVRPDLGLDVPYSFVAFMAANGALMICEGRGEDRAGAHTKGHNTAGIAVSFAGNFENGSADSVEISKRMPLLSFFLGWLRHNPSHPSYGEFQPMIRLGNLQPQGRHVFYHKDFKSTDCPGSGLIAHLPQVDFVAPPVIH